ncbi:MAG: hypothetical protein DDT36_00160 [Firmicutes bacterium]|nr:hypothetical protein [Bacillota bacterium]
MEIFQFVIVALAVAMAALLLKQLRPELGLVLVVVASVVLLMTLIGRMAVVIELVKELAERADVGSLHLNTLLRIMGVAFVAEFGAGICKDAGENSLALKVELAGKLIILGLSVPLVLVILETLLRLIP